MKSTRVRTSSKSEVRLWCSTIVLVTAQLPLLILRPQHSGSRGAVSQGQVEQLTVRWANVSEGHCCCWLQSDAQSTLLIGRKGRGSHKSRTEERFRKTKFITLTGLGRRHSRATWKITQVVTGRRQEEESLGLHLYQCGESKIGQVKGQDWLIWIISKGLGLIGMVL